MTGLFGNRQGGGGLFGNQQGGGGGGGLFGNQQQGQQQGGGSGGLFGNRQQQGGGGGGLFGNQQQGQQQGGGGLFGNRQQGQQQGGGGGGLFGNQQGGQQQQGGGGGLFGNQQQQGGGGGGLFGNRQSGSGGLFGSQQGQQQGSGGSGGLFGNKQSGGGGGLFGSSQQQGGGGGLFGNRPSVTGTGTGTGGSLFGGGQQQGSSLLGAKPGQTSLGGGGTQMGQTQMLPLYQPRPERVRLDFTNPIKDRKVGQIEKYKNVFDGISKVLTDNKKKIELIKDDNIGIINEKEKVFQQNFELAQNSRQLYLKIKQARFVVDEMKSSFTTYDEITKDFDICIDMLRGGRLPRIDIPSQFIINITDYFNLRFKELKDKIGEIEELVKMHDKDEDHEDYENIILVIEELYTYYLDISHQVFRLNEATNNMKVQFIEFFKSQGNREVEKKFGKRDVERPNHLVQLEKIANLMLQNKLKARKDIETHAMKKH